MRWMSLILVGLIFANAAGISHAEVERIFLPGSDVVPEAVRARNEGLIHTTQIFPSGNNGRVAERSSLQEQLGVLFSNLDHILTAAGSSRENTVRVNLYLAEVKDGPVALSWLAQRYGRMTPALSVIGTPLPLTDALVAADAVAMQNKPSDRRKAMVQPANLGKSLPGTLPGFRRVAVLPRRAVYVSGMADTNALPLATQKTLGKLGRVLEQLGLGKADVVQLKAFFQPMSQVDQVLAEVRNFFTGHSPPTVLVEWDSPKPNPPIEIEMIVDGTEMPAQADTVMFLTPAGTTSTKVFSRVAVADADQVIYFSGLYPGKVADGVTQTRELFSRFNAIAQRCDSDIEHLVKATYFVCDNAAGDALNSVRPEFFNAARPPAASKAKVAAVGLGGKHLMIDMIAVPTGQRSGTNHLPSTPSR